MLVDNAQNGLYPTTDHLITCVKINGVHFLYVSLDNSVRANMNNHPLYMRLVTICEVVDKIIRSLDDKCIVFFSESCRPSFNGGMDVKENLTSWLSMRRIISKICKLNFLIEKRNNDDYSDMLFGISVFYTNEVESVIQTYFCRSILSEGFGSVTVGIKMVTSEIIWGIHFPLDFKGYGKDNMGYKTMINLQELMNEFKGSVCAFGDFNTIPGAITNAINQAILSNFEFVFENELTFFGSFYDTIPIKNDEIWTSILE